MQQRLPDIGNTQRTINHTHFDAQVNAIDNANVDAKNILQ